MKLSFDKASDQNIVAFDNIFDTEGFMYSAYERLVDILGEVLRGANNERECLDYVPGGYLGVNKSQPPFNDLYTYCKNVIAVSGGRGYGKTSVMLSLSHAMQTKKLNDEQWPKNISDHSFVVLDPIDPTLLEENLSPIMLILSRMYRKVEEAWEHSVSFSGYGMDNGSSMASMDGLRNELVDEFQKCFSAIRAAKTHNDDKSFTSLHSLSDSSRLKARLYSLVETLLRFCSDGRAIEKTLLVIQLDDTDSQVNKSYEVLEDIRKYLTIPNVIVLMATDMDLLYKVVSQHLLQEMKTGIDQDVVSPVEVQNNAYKYLDKLIPPDRVVYLRKLEQIVNHPDDLLRVRFVNKEEIILPIAGEEELPLEDTVLRYLYRKTDILCVSHEGVTHSFIPSTIRGLEQLFSLLASMEDIPTVPNNAKNNRKDLAESLKNRLRIKDRNLRLFEDYLMSTWCNSKFSSMNQKEYSLYEIQHLMNRIVNEPGLDDLCLNIAKRLNNCDSLWRSAGEFEKLSNDDDEQKSRYKHRELFSDIVKEIDKSAGQIERCLGVAICICIALRWNKAAVKHMMEQIPLMKGSNSTFAFCLTSKKTGLPSSFYLNKLYPDKFDEKFRLFLIGEYTLKNHKRLCSTIAPDNEFRVLQIVQAILAMAGNDLEENAAPLVAYSKMEQSFVYDLQSAALIIACNPELQRELIKCEEKYLESVRNRNVEESFVEDLVSKIDTCEKRINTGQHIQNCDFGQFVPLVPDCQRFKQVSDLIGVEGNNEDNKNDINNTNNTNTIKEWFEALNVMICSEIPSNIEKIYKLLTDYCEFYDYNTRDYVLSELQSTHQSLIANLQSLQYSADTIEEIKKKYQDYVKILDSFEHNLLEPQSPEDVDYLIKYAKINAYCCVADIYDKLSLNAEVFIGKCPNE